MKKIYKLALIGGSINSIAGYPHFIASQMDKRFEVTAGVFSRNRDINEQTAKRWHVKKLYDNYQDLIQKEKSNVDAIVILTPTPKHLEIVLALLKENIPIICEKPLANSKEEIHEIEKVYKEDEHFLVITNNYSAYPMIRELQERIKNSELGKVLQIRLKMPQESFLRAPKSIKYPQKWRLTDGFIPMISLDLGAHLHHLAYFLLQEEPIQVSATYNSHSKYKVIDDVNILSEYESGIKSNMWLSKIALGNRNGLHIEVYGTDASASWHQENPEKLELSYTNGQTITIDRGSDINMIENQLYNRMTPGHPAGYIESFANLYNDIANSLDDYFQKNNYTNRYIYSLKHAKDGIDFLHSASLSNKSKKWESI